MGHSLYSWVERNLKSIGIIFIGTGPYIGFLSGFQKRISRFFCPDTEKKIYAFTDCIDHPSLKHENVEAIKIDHVGWPFITLHRFKFMNSISDKLKSHSHIFFIDADLWPVDDMHFSDFFPSNESHNFVAVQHPGFIDKPGTFEDDKNSTAYAYSGFYDLSVYRQGCFWGGKTGSILDMISICEKNVDTDSENKITAKWHDESHMNKYFLQNASSVKTLAPSYAAPEAPGYDFVWKKYKVKMVHLNKDPGEFPRFEGSGN